MSATKQKVDIPCPQCKAKLAVPIAAMGKSGKCPHCGTIFPLAMPPPATAPALPAAVAATAASPLAPLSAPGDDFGLTPLGDADLLPVSAADLAPLPGSNRIADAMPQGNYTLPPTATAPYVPVTAPAQPSAALASQYLANANAEYEENRRKTYAPGRSGCGFGAGILGGVFMMVLAVVWCGVVLLVSDGRRFPVYAPILFVVGIIAFVRGLITGNLTSE